MDPITSSPTPEEKLRAENAELRAGLEDAVRHLVERSPFGVYAVDADFRLVQVSVGAQKVFENVHPLLGRDFAEVLRIVWPEPFASEAIAIFRRVLESGEPYHAPSTVEQRQDIAAVESYDWKVERLTLPDGRPGVVCQFDDLTELKEAEELRAANEALLLSSLRLSEESEERIRLATEATAVGIWEWNVFTNAIRWDAQMFRLYGISPTPDGFVQYSDWRGAVLPEDLPENERILQDTVSTCGRSHREFRIRRREDGEVRDIEAVETVRTNEHGQAEWVLGTNLDITERKRAEDALRESQQFTRRVLDNLFAFVGVMTVDGTLTEANRAPLEAAGIPASEVLGKKFWDCYWWSYSPEIQAQPRDACERAAGGEVVRYDVPVRMAGDTRVWIDFQVAPLRDADGRITHLIPSAMDIAVRRAAVESLRESETLKSSILDSALDAIITMDHEGKVVGFNPAAERTFGFRQADMVGQLLAEKIIPEHLRERHYQGLTHYLASGEGPVLNRRIEVPALHADGHEFDIELSINRITGIEPPLFTATLRDITERKQAEEALRASQAALEFTLESAQVGGWDLDLIHDTSRRSLRHDQCFGYHQPIPEAEWGFERFIQHVHPEDRARVKRDFQDAMGGLKDWQFECRVVWPDESIHWIDVHGSIYHAEDGKPLRMLGIIANITERKRADLELANREAHLRRVINNQLGLVGVIDRDGILLEVDDRSMAIAKARREEVIGKHFADAPWWNYDREVAEQMRDAMRRALAGEVVRYDVSLFAHGEEGVMIDFMIAPVFGDDGEVEYLIPSGVDIRERYSAEQKLKVSEEFSRTVLESSPDSVNILNGEGRLQSMNSNGLCQLEIDDFASFQNEFWWKLWGAENVKTAKQAVKKALQGETAHFQASGPTAKGTLKWWDVIVSPIPGIEGRTERLISVSREITEQMNQAEALKKAHEELEARVKERTRDLAKTNAMLEKEIAERKAAEEQKIALLQRVARTQEDERSRIARDLHDQMGQRLTGLRLKLQFLMGVAGDNEDVYSGLLALSEIGQTLDDDIGFFTWELRPAIIDELGLTAALASYVNEWEKRFAIPTSFGSTGLAGHRLDPEIEINLYRIVQEALNNAAKYARATHVSVLLQKSGNTITLIVEDNGVGFNAAKRLTSREARHGFGLIGMQERTSLISGVLEIESAPGSGTCILVKIPINHGSQNEIKI